MRTPTTPLGIDIDLTYDYLEEHWADEVAACNAGLHESSCTIKVTHRLMVCWGQVLACESATSTAIALRTECVRHRDECDRCKRLVADCWSVIPV